MKKFLLVILVLCFNVLISQSSKYSVYSGTYSLSNGDKLVVKAEGEKLVMKSLTGNLLDYSDSGADARVIYFEQKTFDLMEASVKDDRKKIAELFGASNGPMDQYIENYLEIISEALSLNSGNPHFEIIGTVYRDEDSNYGFEDGSWGWECYVRFTGGNDENKTVRVVWDGVSGNNMHRGIGKVPPVINELVFEPRLPSRSWIRAYSPDTKTILRVREVERELRKNMVPARFVAYDISTHNTIGIRFRKAESDQKMQIEIGPLNSKVLTKGVRTEL